MLFIIIVVVVVVVVVVVCGYPNSQRKTAFNIKFVFFISVYLSEILRKYTETYGQQNVKIKFMVHPEPVTIFAHVLEKVGTAVAQWLRCCATIRKVAGSIPAGVIGIFH